MRFLIVIWTILFSTLAFSDDATTISYEISKNIEKLFYKKDFSAINEIDNEYRNSQSRLPDGRWKLTFIYSSFSWVSSRGAEDEWQYKFNIVDEWIKATPEHPAPYMAKADLLIAYAWDARGSGWAKDVKPEQWKLFHERIAQAKEILEQPIALKNNHPYWFLKMEAIANAQSWPVEDFIKLYEKAVALYPTYYFIHFRAADYFQPRWNGSKTALRKFVDNAVEKTKDQEGYTLYARIYWSQLWAFKDQTFEPGNAEWKYMKKGFEDIMKDYPASTWNLNAFAFYACQAKDWKTTDELIAQLADAPNLSIWGSQSRFYTCAAQAKNH